MAPKSDAAVTDVADTTEAPAPGNRRAEILGIAAELFAEKGVENTTVRQIGTAAGILSGSLYHYFDSKESICTEVVTGYLEQRVVDCRRIAQEHDDPREVLAALMRTELHDVSTNAAARVVNTQSIYLIKLMPAHEAIRTLAISVRDVWMAAISAGIEQGHFRDDVDPELFYALARKCTSLAIQMWVGALTDGLEYAADRYGVDGVADAWIKILLGGYATTDD